MSLRQLVAFAQENFGALSDAPGLDDMGDASKIDVPSPNFRPRSPHWIGPTADRDLPFDGSHQWRIEGPIDPQEPPPEVERFGMDALAFWVPFHFYRQRWGIYIRTSGVLYLAEVLKGGGLLPGDEEYCDLAEDILLKHERMHAMIEIACTRAEMVGWRSLYQPYFADPVAWEHEEALANAQDDKPQVRARAEAWMRLQGPGYRDFGKFLDSRKFSRGVDRAAHLMLKPLPPPVPKASAPSKTFLFYEGTRYNIPKKRINDLPASHATILRPFPKQFGIQVLVHSNDHPPPHIHIQMPPGGSETKYIWPDLIPMKNENPLSAGGEKNLEHYLKLHEAEIEERIRRVYGTTLLTRTVRTHGANVEAE
jgi:hypothetical protein